MITIVEKITIGLAQLNMSEVEALYSKRVAIESDRQRGAVDYLASQGYEVVSEDGKLTSDGREIVRVAGESWALKPEIHAQRLAAAMEQARQRDAAIAEQQAQQSKQATQPTTCTSLIDGQLCGGNLVRAAVCPRCALGKMGVAATLTCDVCGHVTAIMRGAK